MNVRIDIPRFINRLDACFNRNDMKAARECIESWEKEARDAGDERALLTILNEGVGCYRRTQKRGKALKAMQESLVLAEKLGLTQNLSGATIFVNAATTLSFFGEEEKGWNYTEKPLQFTKKKGGRRLTNTRRC